jgi:hypothetical protein
MTNARPGSPGATRACPHCREVILESAGICPACRKFLRFDDASAEEPQAPALTPLSIEGSIRHLPTASRGSTRSSCRFATTAARKLPAS